MRLILFDPDLPSRANFHPLALGRCVWELRCGITTLGEKLVAASGAADAACFVPGYLAGACRERTDMLVNAPESLACDDLLLVNASVKPEGLSPAPAAGEACLDEDGELAWARFAGPSAPPMRGRSIDGLIEWAKKSPNMRPGRCPRWKYIWQLVLENAGRISDDFKRLGLRGIEGRLERQAVIMGFAADVYVAPGAVVHPMAVIDATGGPVFIDEGAAIHSFTRVEGPCHVGKGSILLGAKCREGTSIGPACRVGGEVEESIIQGYSNKYHDGFLGHAYVGEWVNLGALTTNSDLRNDYGPVSVRLDDRGEIDTGGSKVGAFIGDHVKTSIGTLLNTGTYVGAFAMLVASGGLLPKFIPSFCSYLRGRVTTRFGRDDFYATAATAMARRGKNWTDAQRSMWDAVYVQTDTQRQSAAR